MQLYFDTLDIREANLDDVDYHRAASDGRRLATVQHFNTSQARYYGLLSFIPFWIQDSIGPRWLFQLVRLGLVAVSLGVLGRLATRITGSPELAPLWSLLWIVALQIPPTFYGLLSYPAMHCGFILVLLALHRFLADLHDPAPKTISWGAGLLFLASLNFSEAFLGFAPAFPLLWWWTIPAGRRKAAWRSLSPIGAALMVYLGVYLSYRTLHPPSYEGTVAGTNVRNMLLYLFRYSTSSLPGFELVIDRDSAHPALAGWPEIIRRLGTFNPARLPWVLSAGIVAAWALVQSRFTLPRRQAILLAAGLLAIGLLYLGLPAVSAKYQDFAYRRLYPHVYNFIFVHFLWLALAVLGLNLIARHPPGTTRRLICAGLLAFGVMTAGFLSQVTNPLVLQQIRQAVSLLS